MEHIYESKKTSTRTILYYAIIALCAIIVLIGMIIWIRGMQMETLWGIGEEKKRQTIIYGIFLVVCGMYMFNGVFCYLKTKIVLYEDRIQIDAIANTRFPRISRLNVSYNDITSASVKKKELLLLIEGKTYNIECADSNDAEKCKCIIEEKRG